MKPPFVVKDLDVVKDADPGVVYGPESVTVDQLSLEGLPKALRNGVVPAVSLSAHALDTSVRENFSEEFAGVLAATV